MKYRAEVTLKGIVEIEADSIEQAKEIADDGFSLTQFECEDVKVDDVFEADITQEGE